MTNRRYRIGLTQGDPKGIGPEIVATALAHYRAHPAIDLVLYGDSALQGPTQTMGDRAAGRLSAAHVATAVADALAHRIDAVITAPIHKGRWRAAGITAPGHTEYLAQCVCAQQPPATRMLFWTPHLRVVLATAHLPLSAVPTALTPAVLRTTAALTMQFLQRNAGIATPRLACLGLNPHAGEGGMLGTEEEEIIRPTLRQLRTQGLPIDGPFPADSFFARRAPASRASYDAVIALYHDQGLIPIKTLDPHGVVNITLGLPFVRTSVGHGTAEDIAGAGKADPTNLLAVIDTTYHLLGGREQKEQR